MRFVWLALYLLFAGISDISAHAATYYVATTGNNVNDGSEATPWATIKHAVNTMVAGDTTYVRGGTYNSSGLIVFTRTGTQALPIKLLNYPDESPILNCTSQTTADRIELNLTGPANLPIGWITIEGFEIRNCYEGMKWYNLHDSTIRRNWIHDNLNQGILGIGGTRILIEGNIFHHNGNFACTDCTKQHGLYANGTDYKVLHNVFYDNLAYGVQLNGASSSVFNPSTYPSVEFANSNNWVIASNTFAYQQYRGGIVVWGSTCLNARIENNIFYENGTQQSTGTSQGIDFTGASCTGVQSRNNHFYASGSGSQTAHSSGAPPGFVDSGNIVNVSSPSFVNGGSNALPVSPDWTLTASSPAIGVARANEFPANATLTAGAYDTVAAPTLSITTNVMTLIFPMNRDTPIIIPSGTGASISCTANPTACPGSPAVGAVSRSLGTDTHVDIEITGIASNACLVDQDWKGSYNSATGAWTVSSNVGPVGSLHQKIFSFTNLLATDLCTGSGAGGYPGTPHIYYKANEGTGTSLNDESVNNLDGTLTGGGTWGPGKTGTGVVLAGSSGQYVAVPWGSGINPTTQSFTLAFGVDVAAGNTSLNRGYAGSPVGTNQRFYVSTNGGTWRLGIQGSADSVASELSVVAGYNHIVVKVDKDTPGAGTGTATLCVNGVCSVTAGGKKTYTSYTLAGNIEWGRIAGVATGGGGTFDDFLVYLNASVDPSAIYTAFNAAAPPTSGSFAQAAIQAQGVYLDPGQVVRNIGSLNAAVETVASGAVAVLFQVHCQNVADCPSTAFKLMYSKNQTAAAAAAAGTLLQVPNVETADGIRMFGSSTDAGLNVGVTTTRLTGSCAITNGTTQVTSEQVPSVDLPQDGCVMLRYIVRVGNMPGSYFELRLLTESGLALPGGSVDARITVVHPRAGVGL